MEENKLHYHMKVRVFRKEGAFGPGVAELMHYVEETGSLSEACRCMGMAYSEARGRRSGVSSDGREPGRKQRRQDHAYRERKGFSVSI